MKPDPNYDYRKDPLYEKRVWTDENGKVRHTKGMGMTKAMNNHVIEMKDKQTCVQTNSSLGLPNRRGTLTPYRKRRGVVDRKVKLIRPVIFYKELRSYEVKTGEKIDKKIGVFNVNSLELGKFKSKYRGSVNMSGRSFVRVWREPHTPIPPSVGPTQFL